MLALDFHCLCQGPTPPTGTASGIGNWEREGEAPRPWLLMQLEQGTVAAGWKPRGCMLTLYGLLTTCGLLVRHPCFNPAVCTPKAML